ncbi:MAG: AAA family ATPase [Pseudomonadota bacterium]
MPSYLITGCSSGGKSTLLSALDGLGYAAVPEPGRRILAEEREGDGQALPWVNPIAFARRAFAMAKDDLTHAKSHGGPVFFDRGLVDAAVALDHLTDTPIEASLGSQFPYDSPVFLAPPWPEIYQQDADRPHGFEAAKAEYHRIAHALDVLNVQTICLPRTSVAQRVKVVLSHLP